MNMTFNKLYHYILIKLRIAIAQTQGKPWQDLFVELPLSFPYPKGWVLHIHGFGERNSQRFEIYLLETEGDGELGVLTMRITPSSGHSSLLCTLHEILNALECWYDEPLMEAWDNFSDHPYDADSECIEEDFLHFHAGTHREEIWQWFDKRHSKGVHALLYPEEEQSEVPGQLPAGPLFTDEEITFIRKYGARSEADALVKAMNDFAERPNIPCPVDAFAGLLYMMIHECTPLLIQTASNASEQEEFPFAQVVHFVPQRIIDKYTPLMSAHHVDYKKEDIPKYSTIYSTTVEMIAGYEMEVKVCSSDDGDPLWSEAVLFQNGQELSCTDVDVKLAGIWELTYEGKTFVADIRGRKE